MYRIIFMQIICAALFSHMAESFGLAEMISNYAKVSTNKAEDNSTSNARYGIQTYNTTNGTETLEIVPDYDDFDDLEEDNSTTRAAPMDPGSVLKFVNGIVNLVALMSSLNKNLEKPKPRGNLASEVNGLQEPMKYYPIAQDRFHPDTASKKFKMQAAKLSNAIDQQYQPVDTYPPYNPFSGTNAETYNKDNPKTSYDADDDQYKKNKNIMGSYLSGNVDVQPSYSYELPYQPIKMKNVKPGGSIDMMGNDDGGYQYQQASKMKNPMQMASADMESDDNIGYEHHKPSTMKFPMQESPMEDDNDGGYDAYQPHDDLHQMNMDSPPPKSNHPVYEPWKSHDDTDYIPQKSKRPTYITDEDEDADDDDDSTDMAPPPKKPKHPMHSFDDGQSRRPTKNQMPDEDFQIYYPHDHKQPINYHDFHLEHDFHDHPPPPPEEHKVEEEDRESKRPYSYYHLGRKLWYVPLIFSVYFIIYIGALILKSLARHKIQFPEKLWELHDTHESHHEDEHHRRNRRINDVTSNVVNAIENVQNKFM